MGRLSLMSVIIIQPFFTVSSLPVRLTSEKGNKRDTSTEIFQKNNSYQHWSGLNFPPSLQRIVHTVPETSSLLISE